ncbi:unnamed protein product [Ectocarpus fasciculatus]
MKKASRPTVGTLREWVRSYKSMCESRHLPGRKDRTTTLNTLVPGTSFSTAQKWAKWLVRVAACPPGDDLYEALSINP